MTPALLYLSQVWTTDYIYSQYGISEQKFPKGRVPWTQYR